MKLRNQTFSGLEISDKVDAIQSSVLGNEDLGVKFYAAGQKSFFNSFD